MKKLTYLFLATIITIAFCNTASAVYVDNNSLQLLLHCDETNHPNSWLLTPDDHSSGRTYDQAVLDRAPTSWAVDTATIPTLTSGSPVGGNYLHFDGVDDSIYVVDSTSAAGWVPNANSNIICDFSLILLSYDNLNYGALVLTKDWRFYLRQAGATTLKVQFWNVGGTYVFSDNHMNSNKWYDVHFSLIDGTGTLIVSGTNVLNQYISTTNTVENISFTDENGAISIGYDVFSSSRRYFMGDLDEIRLGTIPEPASLIFIGSLLLMLARKIHS